MVLQKYKLGDLIEQYDKINTAGEFSDINNLQGINSNKYFQECKSNKNDIDLFRYRICRHGMFSYNRATSRNGEKISIALRTGDDCIVSPSYYCFRVMDEDVLCPEYLDIWFKRPVFDKYARFNSWGSATEFFSFDDFCATEIMLPPIDEQRKIVRDYRIITDRVVLLSKINTRLEEVLQLLYKQFFLEARPSSNMGIFSDIATVIMGQSPEGDDCNNDGIGEPLLNGPTEFGIYSPTPVQWTTNGNKRCKTGDLLFCVRGSTTGRMNWADQQYVIGRGLAAVRHKRDSSLNWLVKAVIDNNMQTILAAATGSTFPNVSKDLLNGFQIVIPSNEMVQKYGDKGFSIAKAIEHNAIEMDRLLLLQKSIMGAFLC